MDRISKDILEVTDEEFTTIANYLNECAYTRSYDVVIGDKVGRCVFSAPKRYGIFKICVMCSTFLKDHMVYEYTKDIEYDNIIIAYSIHKCKSRIQFFKQGLCTYTIRKSYGVGE